MRVLLLLAVTGVSAAQYDLYDLATNGDGSVAWFVTALPAKGGVGSASDPGRVYRVDAGGMHLYMARTRTAPAGVPGQIVFSNYYDLSHPESSRDGTVTTVMGRRDCTGGSLCSTQPTVATTVSGLRGGAVDISGAGRLSGNGRYVFVYGYGSISSRQPQLVDLSTGQAATLDLYGGDTYNLGAGRVVADDGTVVTGAGSLLIAQRSGTTRVGVSGGSPLEAVIDSAASVVVYARYDWATNTRSIRIYRIATKVDAPLTDVRWGDSHAPYLSADGRRVMFLSGASGLDQIYTIDTDGSALRQVTHEAGGVLAAAMSDDGKAAWYFSGAGRLHRLDLGSGAAVRRMGRTPQPRLASRVVAGSALSIGGAGLSDGVFVAQGYPLPRRLGGVSVAIQGVDAPLLAVTPAEILVQVPWLAGPGDATVEVKTAASSPFEPRVRLPSAVAAAYPTLLTVRGTPSGYGGWASLAVHDDWRSVVSAANPARPNEVVHLFGTGFGRVDGAPADGTPAPANPPVRTIVPVTCWAWGADNRTRLDIPVLFAGLAPGTAGYYQLDVRLPRDNLRTDTQLTCTGEGDNHDFLGSLSVAAR